MQRQIPTQSHQLVGEPLAVKKVARKKFPIKESQIIVSEMDSCSSGIMTK